MIPNDEARMGILEHLEELRSTLIRILCGAAVGAAVCLYFSERVLALLLRQAGDFRGQFVVISPTEGFLVQIKLGLILGVVLSMPWTLRCIWEFLSPGLTSGEKKVLWYSFPVLILLFLVGCSLAWVVALPMAMEFLLLFQVADVTPQLSIQSYVSFCTSLLLVFGGVFETPAFLLALHYSGVLPVSVLRGYRRHVVVGSFVLAAILTPPDVVTQTLLAVPMICLFELTLIVIGWIDGNGR